MAMMTHTHGSIVRSFRRDRTMGTRRVAASHPAASIDGRTRTILELYVGITAIVSQSIAGLLAGWLSGVRGVGAGFFNGLTVG
jgi:hypothetical protein